MRTILLYMLACGLACGLSASDRLTIRTPFLPDGQTQQPYSVTLTAEGGTPPYSWALISGKLPVGLRLHRSFGIISGDIEQAGRFTFTVGLTDAAGKKSRHSYAIMIGKHS